MVEVESLEKVIRDLENVARICKEQLEMAPATLESLGFPSSPEAFLRTRLRVEILENLVLRLRAVPAAQAGPAACQDFIAISNEHGAETGRIVCERPLGHDGSHKRCMSGRKGTDRTDAEVTWKVAPYLQKVP